MKGPTEKAVALKYDPGSQEAPLVVAKGAGEIAQKIIDTAKQHGVPITEDPDLVQLLMALDVGETIPPELYKAVAVVLAFVYRTNRKILNLG